ncbi:hypothetical protein GCM10027418_18950 [Mariniluteicoccus endophyticus]
MTALRVEMLKLRRLRVWLIAGVVSLATVLFSSIQLFDKEYRAHINDPQRFHWAGILLGYAMIKSMLAPVFAAVVASRVVDVEHQGNGWSRSALSGLRTGGLCGVKLAVLIPLLVAVSLAELLVLYAGSRAAGATTPLPAGPWAWFAAASVAITVLLVAGHLWLAARVDSQLVVLGVGVLGGFIGVFAMLMPPLVARLTPWGQYAAALPFTMTAGADNSYGYAALPIPWATTLAFLLVAGVLVYAGLRHLDHTEV